MRQAGVVLAAGCDQIVERGALVTAFEVEPLTLRQSAYGDGLAFTVQHLADEIAGIDAVDLLGHRA